MMWWALVLGCQPARSTPDPASVELNEHLADGRAALMAAGIEELRLAVHPVLDEPDPVGAWQPLVDHVSSLVGVPIQLSAVQDYGELEQQILDGQVDGGWMTPYDYVQADRILDLHVVATPIVGGSLTYNAYLVAMADQPVRELRSVADLEGAPLGFVAPRSASGWAFPAVMLLEAGLDPFENARFERDHHAVLDAVQEGRVLAGAVYGGLYRGPPLQVIAKSEPIPYDALVLRGGVPLEAAIALGAAFNTVDTRTERGRALLKPLSDVNGFVAVGPDHYDEVRRVDEVLQAAQ